MSQLNSPDNNNCTHLVFFLNEGLLRGEDASDIYKKVVSNIYGETPKSTMMSGSTLENLHDLSQYKSKLKQPNQQRNSQDNSPLIVPGESIYDRRPYNSNNSTNGSGN